MPFSDPKSIFKTDVISMPATIAMMPRTDKMMALCFFMFGILLIDENIFNTHVEQTGNTKCEGYGGVITTVFQRADRLASFTKKYTSFIVHRSAYFVAAAYCPVKSHDHRDRAIDFLSGFLLISLDVASRIQADEDVVHHLAEHRMAAVGNPEQ